MVSRQGYDVLGERAGVGLQSAMCLASCSSRVGLDGFDRWESTAGGVTRCTQDVAVALLARRVE